MPAMFRKSDMVRMPVLVKRVTRVGLLAAMIAAAALVSTPASAGPINQYPIVGPVTEQSPHETMMDPIPCTPVRGRHGQNDPSQASCPDVYAGAGQTKTSRQPGPSAFGLQFNSGDY